MITIKKDNLARAVNMLKHGKVIIFPTETSYGLGCDASNQKAVDRIFKIKKRRSQKALLVIVATMEEAKKYLVWNALAEKLARKYWPGPLTIVGEYNRDACVMKKKNPPAKPLIIPSPIVVKAQAARAAAAAAGGEEKVVDLMAISKNKKGEKISPEEDDEVYFEDAEEVEEELCENLDIRKMSKGVVSANDTLALRVSSHPVANILAWKLGRPIVATSANIGRKGDIYEAEKIRETFSDCLHCPDGFLDYGDLSPDTLPTTIVSVIEGSPRILRQGEIKI